MPTKEEIIATIQQGTAQVERVFGSLTEEQLQTRIHEDAGGWTAEEVLAHLAARQPVNDRLLLMAAGDGAPATSNLNMDEWNQALVGDWAGKSRDELLVAFKAVQEALITEVRSMSYDTLAKAVPLQQGVMPLGDLLGMAGGLHAEHHAQEVEQALARSATRPLGA